MPSPRPLTDLPLSKTLIIPAAARQKPIGMDHARRQPGFYAGQAVTYTQGISARTTAVIVEMHGNVAELDDEHRLRTDALTLVESDEQWKPIEGFDGRYLVSSHGKVVSTQYQRQARERLLRPTMTAGVAVVRLQLGSTVQALSVARLVALHFLPPPYYKQLIPRDGDNANLRADNLLWLGTGGPLDPTADYRGRAGEQHFRSRLTDEQVVELRAAYAAGNVSYRDLATRYGIAHATVASLVRGTSRRAIKKPATPQQGGRRSKQAA